MTRAAVRTITTFTGKHPPNARIELRVDEPQVYVGSAVSGTVTLHLGGADVADDHPVQLALEGVVYTVVALPRTGDYSNTEMEYLREHTTEQKVLIRQEISLRRIHGKPQGFRLGVPNGLPGTLRCVLDGTHSTLPSQCQIKYSLIATLSNQMASSIQVSHPIVVLPRKESDLPLDASVSVTAGSGMDVLFSSLFQCGSMLLSDENLSNSQCVPLESSHDKLSLSAGQFLKVDIQDWFGHLKKPGNVWMIRLTEELGWRARGRTAHNRCTWDLFANHHELPTSLKHSFRIPSSLIYIRHELEIYLTTKDTSKDVLASTKPILVQVVSNQRGWDA